jgi:DNA-binding CsgD family transcriptional regulator
MSVAQRPRDRNDAALARCIAALFLEDDRLPLFMQDLDSLEETTAEDRIRILMTRQSVARLMSGLYDVRQEADAAKALLQDVANPVVRAGWGNIFGYTLILQARYPEAHEALTDALNEVRRYGLQFAVPHLEWSLAAAELGLRRFARTETFLRRVEKAARETSSVYLELNARALRARLMLALRRPRDAIELTAEEFDGFAARAMVGEYLATRALALAANRHFDEAATAAERAERTSQAVEVKVLVASAWTVKALQTDDQRHWVDEVLTLATKLETWDGLVCAMRAVPSLATALASSDSYRSRLLEILDRSRDAQLAFSSGLTSKRPSAKRGVLSPRELEVLDLLAQGLKTRDIASLLYISESTVKVHVHHIFEKLDVRTRAEAVARYAEAIT